MRCGWPRHPWPAKRLRMFFRSKTARRFVLVVIVSALRISSEIFAVEPAGSPAVRVAGIVLKWIRTDKEANYQRVEPMIREAAAGGAPNICPTEGFLDGDAIAGKKITLEQNRALGGT